MSGALVSWLVRKGGHPSLAVAAGLSPSKLQPNLFSSGVLVAEVPLHCLLEAAFTHIMNTSSPV